MAVFQGEIILALGYGVNTLSRLQGEAVSSIGYTRHTTFLITGEVNNSLSSSTDALTFIKAVNALPFSNYQPYQSRFARFFGVGARQDSTKLYIAKADLGLSLINNTAESILVALLLHAMRYEANSLISNVYVSLFAIEYITVNLIPVIQTVLLVQLNALAIYSYPVPSYPYGIITNATTLPAPNQF